MTCTGHGSGCLPSRDRANASSVLVARTFSTAKQFEQRNLRSLCRAFQRDDRQVPRLTMEVDLECAPIAGLSRDERARSGTG